MPIIYRESATGVPYLIGRASRLMANARDIAICRVELADTNSCATLTMGMPWSFGAIVPTSRRTVVEG